jgi:hypothetical protein
MSINLDKLHNNLKSAAATFNLVPFIGAGISRQAKFEGKVHFPTWREFLEDLKNRARDDDNLSVEDEKELEDLVAQGKFLMVAQHLKERIHDSVLDTYFEDRFLNSNVKPAPIHYALFKLRPPIIVTTNYDCLLEDTYASLFGSQTNAATATTAFRVQQRLKNYHPGVDRPLVFKIHGTATDPRGLVYAEQDYRNLTYGHAGYRAVISALFVSKVVLMLGFSFSDPEVTLVLQALREAFKERSNPDYIVLRKGFKKKIERARLQKDFGLEVIEYEPSDPDDGEELVALIEHLASFVPAEINKSTA